MVKLKRIYEPAHPEDGCRVLVERLWPRGISKTRAALDLWLKDVAPSPELRTWFEHDPAKWDEFRKRYWEELEQNEDAVDQLRELARKGDVTFVYAAKDTEHNAAVALNEFIEQ
ncbi:MAG: DUF488 domain-containing protein [Armatimonadetes bacterium]|nr:DUF488 domain-containing protein [Armatimonadota bacterium]